MAANKYLSESGGSVTEVQAKDSSAGAGDSGKIVALNASGVLDSSIVNSKTTSAGAGDSGKLPALDGSGKLDESFLPTGIGADTQTAPASEALSAGDLVNIWDDAGTTKVRKADATSVGKEAHGFVLASVLLAGTATIYFEGSNTGVTGLTGGKQYLATTAGQATITPPSGSGNVVQVVGFATSATALNFQSGTPITKA